MIEKISTKNMSHEEWLLHRSKTIGGSDAATIVGLNEWCSPYALWCEKLGKVPPKEDNEAMRQGRDLEEYVASRFTEATGKKVQRCNFILKNIDYPFAHANIDRQVVGEKAGLECKTTSIMNLKKFKNGEFPANYYVQCMHYMAVTGYERWYLAVLVLNQGFYTFEIQRDDNEIKALMDAEKEFYELVLTETPPPVDGTESTDFALKTIYADSISNESPVDLMAYQETVENYVDIEEEIKKLEKLQNKYKQELQEVLHENELGMCDLGKVTWKSQSRSTFQAKEFQNDNPEIDLSNYFKESSFRVFKVNSFKNK